MGGQALVHCTRRYNASEYYPLVDRLLIVLDSLFPECISVVIPAYKTKESFGDVDIVIESDKLPSNWVSVIIYKFGLSKEEYKKNSNVLSFKFEEIQVDLITVSSAEFKSSVDYFSYNDLNNLVGRISKKLGFKIGHDGLSLIVRPRGENTDHIIEEILLSRDIRIAYEMIGISDPTQFKEGFNTLEDIFYWVSSSKYFNPEIFLLENRNATSRVRDKKRKTYNSFLLWCEENKDWLTHYPFPSKDERGGYNLIEPYYSEIILKYFPDAKAKVDATIAKYELNKEFKKIFNGELVGEITGLSGKSLGGLISTLKIVFTDKQFYIDNPELIIPLIEVVYENTKHKYTNS